MRKLPAAAAFSLVELTLAIGIAAVCLISVFALIPVAALTNRHATSQTAATNIIASVVADLRATTASTSPQYRIAFGTSKTLYFDGAGQATTSLSTDSRYQLNVTWSGSPGLRYADVKVTWPAAVAPENASGSAEMFAAFDRS